MKSLLRKLAFVLCSKRVDEACIERGCITLQKDELRCFPLSTNTIWSFAWNGKLYYFRECSEILPFRQYCARTVDSFFDNLRHIGISEEHFKEEIPILVHFSDDIIEKFRKDIDRRMHDDAFYRAMKDMDATATQQGFSIWDRQAYDKSFVERLGLVGVGDDLVDIAIFFLWYMRSAALAYRDLRIVRGKRYSYFNAAKSICSAIVAEEMGLASLITEARFCTLKIEGGKALFGIISPAASGCRMKDTPIKPTGALQRELSALHLLDAIMHQCDHGPNNYNVSLESDHCQICAFDNDNPYTFFPFFSVRRSLAGCHPLVDKNGMINLPFLDQDTFDALCCVDVKRLKKRLKPYLNGLQIAALFYRIKKIRQAIEKTQKYRRFLIKPDKFNEETVCAELGGNYGVTYLSKAIGQKHA